MPVKDAPTTCEYFLMEKKGPSEDTEGKKEHTHTPKKRRMTMKTSSREVKLFNVLFFDASS